MATRKVLLLILLICATSNGLLPDDDAAAAGRGDTSPRLLGGGGEVANKGEREKCEIIFVRGFNCNRESSLDDNDICESLNDMQPEVLLCAAGIASCIQSNAFEYLSPILCQLISETKPSVLCSVNLSPR